MAEDMIEERGALAMREFVSAVVESYAAGCEANPDREAGRIAANVARSIGRLIAEITPGAAIKRAQGVPASQEQVREKD